MQANPVNFPKYYDIPDSDNYYGHTLFGNSGTGDEPNPYADMVRGYKDRFSSTILSQFQLEQDLSFITEGLQLRGMASIRSYGMSETSRSFNPYYYQIDEFSEGGNVNYTLNQIREGTQYLEAGSPNQNANSNFYFEAVAQYSRTFTDKHDVGALLVFTRSEALNTIYEEGNQYATLPSRNLGISGRVTYGYDSRYFTELNFGYNGSEKFAENHRFGFFPSAGIGWVISNENFFSPLKNTSQT